MNNAFPRLFQPGKIGAVELKNRVVKAPQHTGLANPDGSVTERLLRHYRSLARGGAGLITVEYAWVDQDASKASPCQLGIASVEHQPGLSLLVQTIQANGAKASIQISHAGRQRFTLEEPKAPSPVPWEELYALGCPAPKELTFAEILEIVKAFGAAALRAEMAGFDMVELHACHGYLISNFLSPRTNKRTDWYGGSLENRMRFLLEVVAEIRKQVSPSFPVVARLSGTDYEVDGHTIEETVELSKRLEALGVAAIHMSGGNHHQTIHEVSPMGMSLAHNTWAAEAVKKHVRIPVIASGSITSPALAESILNEGKGDFIGLGRPLWADPEWPKKAKAGRAEDIRPCIRCNDGCLARGDHIARTIWCSVNVEVCREEEYKITPAETRRKVAVVGGGPAGLEAARVAALKGHEVTLFEKRQLGGALIEAALPAFKAPDLDPLIAYLSTQMARLTVTVRNEEATAETLVSEGYDAVIVATGSTPIGLCEVPGITSLAGLPEGTVLDGELVVMEDGRPSRTSVVRRMSIQDDLRVRALAERCPATLVAFDLLHLNAQSWMARPLIERRAKMLELTTPLNGVGVLGSPGVQGRGLAMHQVVEAQRLEGVMAKRLDGPYLAGRRSPLWLKVLRDPGGQLRCCRQ